METTIVKAELAVKILRNYYNKSEFNEVMEFSKNILDNIIDKKVSANENMEIYIYDHAYRFYLESLRRLGKLEELFNFIFLDGPENHPTYRLEKVFPQVSEEILEAHHLKTRLIEINAYIDAQKYKQADAFLEDTFGSILIKPLVYMQFNVNLRERYFLECKVYYLRILINIELGRTTQAFIDNHTHKMYINYLSEAYQDNPKVLEEPFKERLFLDHKFVDILADNKLYQKFKKSQEK